MSAAEKLRALDGEIHPEAIRSLGKYQSAHFKLAAALPQIVAVVEAVEQTSSCSDCVGGTISYLDEDDYTVWDNCPKCGGTGVQTGDRLATALAALDEALT